MKLADPNALRVWNAAQYQRFHLAPGFQRVVLGLMVAVYGLFVLTRRGAISG